MMSDQLLADVKNYLDITWIDEASDKKLTGIITRGMASIDSRSGKTQNYETEGKAKELLFEYCLYARSAALPDFYKNYKSELLALRLEESVNQYEIEQATV